MALPTTSSSVTDAAWATALGEPPLDTLSADATAALASEAFTAATARVEGDVAEGDVHV